MLTQVSIPIKQGTTPVNLVVWIRQANSKPEANSCGGEEEILSVKSDGYQTCDVHKDSNPMVCGSAFPDQLTGETQWVYAAGKGKNKWVELKLRSKYQLTKFEYKPIANQVNNIKKLKVVFDDESEEVFELLKLDMTQEFEFESKQTQRVIFEIAETYQNELESGGSFHVHGLKCEALNEAEPLDERMKVDSGCGETVFNHPLLSSQVLKPGVSFKITCQNGCPHEGSSVYGTNVYEFSSSLCAAAMHSGAIEDDGGEFKVQLIEPEKEFKGSEQNGVLSRDKISSTFSIIK